VAHCILQRCDKLLAVVDLDLDGAAAGVLAALGAVLAQGLRGVLLLGEIARAVAVRADLVAGDAPEIIYLLQFQMTFPG
jgi:hypothetical protein